MAAPGIFVVLEGSDGSGKGTQFKLLAERLQATGHDIAVFDFPRYDQPSSHFVQKYLNGEYGTATAVSPYAASLFFALDRFEAGPDIKKAIDEGKVVLANRYVGSNMAHQGSKFGRPSEKRAFFMWEDNLEYEVLGIPRPTISLFLRVPAELSFELIKLKSQRSYTKASHDQHEADINHLRESVASYDLLCQLFPKDFKAISSTRNGQLLSIPEINNKIWQVLKPLLPEPSHKGRPRTFKLEQSREPASAAETKTDTNRLSGLSIVELLGAGAEIKSDIDGQLNEFHIPKALNGKSAEKYRKFMQENLAKRQSFRKQLNKLTDGRRINEIRLALMLATPLAFLESIELELSDVKSWPALAEIKNIKPESVPTGKATAVNPGLGYPTVPDTPVQLIKASYRNETEALTDADYAVTDQSHAELTEEIDRLPYDQKLERLRRQLLKQRNVRQMFTYTFEAVANYPIFVSLAKHGLVEKLLPQPPTVRFGYDIPDIIEDNGLGETYSELFDASLELYSQLQTVHPDLAAYAVMRGHKSRWRITTSADHLAKAAKLDSLTESMLNSMKQQITVANPIVGDYLSLASGALARNKAAQAT